MHGQILFISVQTTLSSPSHQLTFPHSSTITFNQTIVIIPIFPLFLSFSILDHVTQLLIPFLFLDSFWDFVCCLCSRPSYMAIASGPAGSVLVRPVFMFIFWNCTCIHYLHKILGRNIFSLSHVVHMFL